jgi:hypothetical protein
MHLTRRQTSESNTPRYSQPRHRFRRKTPAHTTKPSFRAGHHPRQRIGAITVTLLKIADLDQLSTVVTLD